MKIQRRHALINNGRCRVETMVAIIKDRTGPRGERRAGRLRGPPLEAALRGPSPRKRASFLFSFWWKSQNVGFFATLSDGRKPPCGGSGRLEQEAGSQPGTFLIFSANNVLPVEH